MQRRVIWLYDLADFDEVCDLLKSLNLNIFLQIIKWRIVGCIGKVPLFASYLRVCPKLVLPDKSHPPWLTRLIIQAIRKRYFFFPFFFGRLRVTGFAIPIKSVSPLDLRSALCNAHQRKLTLQS